MLPGLLSKAALYILVKAALEVLVNLEIVAASVVFLHITTSFGKGLA